MHHYYITTYFQFVLGSRTSRYYYLLIVLINIWTTRKRIKYFLLIEKYVYNNYVYYFKYLSAFISLVSLDPLLLSMK